MGSARLIFMVTQECKVGIIALSETKEEEDQAARLMDIIRPILPNLNEALNNNK
jgi:hypothetical protein